MPLPLGNSPLRYSGGQYINDFALFGWMVWEACLSEVARLNSSPVSAGESCESCEPAGVFATDGSGPFDCPDCGKKAAAQTAVKTAESRAALGVGGAAQVSAGGVDDRAAFEAWYETTYGISLEPEFRANHFIGYVNDKANHRWTAWQARAALSAPTYRAYTTTPGEAVAGIALRQLGDESRWVEIRDLNAHAFPDIGPHDYYPVGTELRLPALSAPSHGEQVREGWQLVPVEPTDAMLEAGDKYIGTPATYKSMLSACPSPAITKDFSQFLSAVMDAAGLIRHGRQSKELSEYLGMKCMEYRGVQEVAFNRGESPMTSQPKPNQQRSN